MFVHHYISTMHEMGHTMLRNGSLGAGGSQTEGEGEIDTNARNSEKSNAKETGSSRKPGSRRRPSDCGAKENSSGRTAGSTLGSSEGRVLVRIKRAQESNSGRQGGSIETDVGRAGPGQGGATAGDGTFGLLGDYSERKISEVCLVVLLAPNLGVNHRSRRFL